MKIRNPFVTPLATAAALLAAAVTNHAQTWETYLPPTPNPTTARAFLIDPFSADPANPSLIIATLQGDMLHLDPDSSGGYQTSVADPGVEMIEDLAFRASDQSLFAVGQVWQSTSRRGGHYVWRVRKSTYDPNNGWGTWSNSGADFSLSASEDARAQGCVVDALGNVYVAGTATLKNIPHWIVRKLAAGGGNWQTVTDIASLKSSASASVGGMCYYPGTQWGFAPMVFVTGELNGKGTIQRLAQNGASSIVNSWPSSTKARSINYDSQGNLYAVGSTEAAGASTGGWIIRRSTDGGNSWATMLSEAGGFWGNPASLAEDSAGNVWVVGNTGTSSDSSSSRQWTVVQHQPGESWTESWAHRQHLMIQTSFSAATVIRTDGFGNVFVLGNVENWNDGEVSFPGYHPAVQRLVH